MDPGLQEPFGTANPLLIGQHGPSPETPKMPQAFIVLLCIATVLMGYVIWPFRSPLFLAGVLATAAQPLLFNLTRLLRGRRNLAASILTFLLFLLLVAPFASILAFGIREVAHGLEWVRDALKIASIRDISFTELPENIDKSVQEFLAYLHMTREDLRDYAGRGVDYVQSIGPGLVNFSVGAATDALIMLLAFYFLVVDGRLLVRFVVSVSPLRPAQTQELLQEFRNVSSAALLGTVVTAVLQGLVIIAGFSCADVPQPVFFGLVTLLASFIPVVGATLVWGPAALLLAVTHHTGAGIGLAVWCGVMVGIADHVIKPLVLGGRVEMHGGLVFLSLLGGLAMFGLVGIVAGPLVVAFFLALLRMYQRDFLVHPLAM